MAWPIAIRSGRIKTPGIGLPSPTRWYAAGGTVETSCDSNTRPWLAAHSKMSGSGVRMRPTSCTRTSSSSGCRRNKPRTMSPLKFSSLTRRSMYTFFLGPTSHQADSQLGPVGLLGLDRSADRLPFLRPLAQVLLHFSLVSEIPGEHRVHVGQLERVIALDNSLGSRPILEGVYDALEQNARAGDAQ